MDTQAIYGIVFSEDRTKVLLVLRRDLPIWVLPGGGLEPNETPAEGVAREVEEETGFQVTPFRQVAEYLPVNSMTKRTHVFECIILRGKMAANCEAREISFFPVNDLPSRLPPPFPGWIADALDKKQEIIRKPIEGVSYTVLLKLLCQHPILVLRYFLTKIGIRFNNQH